MRQRTRPGSEAKVGSILRANLCLLTIGKERTKMAVAHGAQIQSRKMLLVYKNLDNQKKHAGENICKFSGELMFSVKFPCHLFTGFCVGFQTLAMIEQTEKEAMKEGQQHIRKKTHKGEVEVEDEDMSTLVVSSHLLLWGMWRMKM